MLADNTELHSNLEDCLKCAVVEKQGDMVGVLSAVFAVRYFANSLGIPLIIVAITILLRFAYLCYEDNRRFSRETTENERKLSEELKKIAAETAEIDSRVENEKKRTEAEISELRAKVANAVKKADCEVEQVRASTTLEKQKADQSDKRTLQEMHNNRIRSTQRLLTGLSAAIEDKDARKDFAAKLIDSLVILK